MEGLKRTLALAAFEFRLNRRMVRVWVLGAISLLLPFGQLAQLFAVHRFFAGFSGSWAIVTRDLGIFQPSLFHGLILGVFGVFYAFDWRHRDQSSHFAASLDASPLTRLQHAWGKFLGLAPVVLAPLLVLLLAQIITTTVGGVRIPLGVYLTCYLVFAVPIALTPLALAVGMAGLVRSSALGRLLAIVVPIAWLGAGFGAGFGLAEKWAVLLGGLVDVPVWSDWVGYEWSTIGILQRAMALVLIVTFVSLASLGPLGLPQDARERRRRGTVVLASLAAAVGLSATVGFLYVRESDAARAVVAAERAASELPGVTAVRRDVEIDLSSKGRLSGTATLRVRNDGTMPLDAAPLRLNAGLAVTSASVDGAGVEVRRDRTVVTVPLRGLAPGSEATIELAYAGRIDADSVDALSFLRTREAKAIDRNNRRVLGNGTAYLERTVAVLPSDAGFYPDTAIIQGPVFPDRRYPDLAPARMTVTLPEGWTAAGTGVRVMEGRVATFTSDEPVAGMALCAGPYREASMEAGGTTFRLFWHPRHGRNIEFFASAKDAIAAAAAERVEDIKARTGLSLPREISVVDVPQLIAVFGGTWDSPNRLAQPGVIMAKEGAVFGTHFGWAYKQAEDRAKKSGGQARAPDAANATKSTSGVSEFDPVAARVDVLRRFLATDFTGGSIERLAMRSAWDARVQPVGDGLPILGPALSAYVAELALERFTVDTAECARLINDGQVIGPMIQALQSGRDDRVTEIVMGAIVDSDDVYAEMVETPVEKMDPSAKPREWAGILFVKGRRPLLALREVLGAEGMARAVGSLADAGRFDWPAFREAMLAHAPEAERDRVIVLLDNWLAGTRLPGFVTEKPEIARIPGEPERWQLTTTISNVGDADGLARLIAGEGKDAIGRLVAVPAGARVQAGMILPRKVERWKLEPFLALNRTAPAGTLAVAEALLAVEPFEGVREAPPATGAEQVVVDNLDAGFTVVQEGEPIAYGAVDDKGKRKLARWQGWRSPSSWRAWRHDGNWTRPYGRFDNTAAVKEGTSDGSAPASWKATLAPGTWRVEAYLPAGKNPRGAQPAPAYEFVIVHAAGSDPVTLSLDGGQEGWNDLGRFRFDGDAEVRLLDKGKGLIVADAIRFTRSAE